MIFLVLIESAGFLRASHILSSIWASEASPSLGCSIEISRDIYM